jgi:ABC-type uncharacterized transport system ATPase subunit
MPTVTMDRITKRFPGILANNQVSFELQPGEVHALLGENGAGKSTLMHILTGLYRPDEGTITVDGQIVQLRSPKDALDRGIGMVHQHFTLVDTMTVAENFLIGQQGGMIKLGQIKRKIRELSQQFHLPVNPDAYIWQLSVGEQQRVEILRLLHRGANILILDEPTSVLTPQETNALGKTLRQLTAEGKAVIFITHKLREVMKLSDRVTILRRGRNTETLITTKTTSGELARHMIGREIRPIKNTESLSTDTVVLQLRNLHANNDRGLSALRGVTLDVHEGEIVGIVGVAGNGQRELAEVITGLRQSTEGTVHINRQNTTLLTTYSLVNVGVGHIPEDRLGIGVIRTMRVSDNLALKGYRNPPLSRGPILNHRAIGRFARALVSKFNISAAHTDIRVETLSGGNIQKVILAREITASHGLIIAAQPTQGLDIQAIESVHQVLLDIRRQGVAILLISEDLDELLALSDRVAVIFDGRIIGIADPKLTGLEEIGLMMAGTTTN